MSSRPLAKARGSKRPNSARGPAKRGTEGDDERPLSARAKLHAKVGVSSTVSGSPQKNLRGLPAVTPELPASQSFVNNDEPATRTMDSLDSLHDVPPAQSPVAGTRHQQAAQPSSPPPPQLPAQRVGAADVPAMVVNVDDGNGSASPPADDAADVPFGVCAPSNLARGLRHEYHRRGSALPRVPHYERRSD